MRYEVLQRDNSTCQRCGNQVKDGVRLEIDHKIPVNWGGSNEIDNLWTLCNQCNGGKKHLFADFDEEIMKEVFKEENGYRRLKKLFELNPNVIIEPNMLATVSGIRDWTRTIRLIRDKEKMNIAWVATTEHNLKKGYMLELI